MLGLFCEALSFQYEIAQRRDAVAQTDALLDASRACPSFLLRQADHARHRGQAERAAELYRILVTKDPSHLRASYSLSDALVAAGMATKTSL